VNINISKYLYYIQKKFKYPKILENIRDIFCIWKVIMVEKVYNGIPRSILIFKSLNYFREVLKWRTRMYDTALKRLHARLISSCFVVLGDNGRSSGSLGSSRTSGHQEYRIDYCERSTKPALTEVVILLNTPFRLPYPAFNNIVCWSCRYQCTLTSCLHQRCNYNRSIRNG